MQKESKITHDPHYQPSDKDLESLKSRLTELLKLRGRILKADFAGQIAKGMRDTKEMREYIPWIVIAVVAIAGLIFASGVLQQ